MLMEPFISGEVDPIISSSISNNRNDYWEELGTMSAQGFENYGYTAPTLSDSSSDGIFWSKYIVVAHTQENDIYFVSEVDSGYSVDNIAPIAPEAFSTEFDSGILIQHGRMILTLIYSIMRFLRMEISILKQLKSNSQMMDLI